MEDKFNQNDFEEFLQDQVRNHRMYPNDAVWREIDKKLHGEKRWPALTVAATSLLTATVLICVYFTPKPDVYTIPTAHVNTSTLKVDSKNTISNNPSALTYSEVKTNSINGAAAIEHTIIPQSAVTAQNSFVEAGANVIKSKLKQRRLENTSKHKMLVVGGNPVNANLVADSFKDQPGKATLESVQKEETPAVTSDASNLTGEQKKAKQKQTTGGFKDEGRGGDHLKTYMDNLGKSVSKKLPTKNNWSYQLYFAPSISYRKLLEDNSILKANNGGPVGLNNVTDVNKIVRHKPATGIEAGISFMYRLSNKVRVKSGFQFNVRQYGIDAYRANTELASIALRGSNGIDTINTIAIYRNTNGDYSTELVNRYYQLSVPIGLEWEIIGNDRIQFNLAGTIQPTYLINRNAYLLSTNFKNYTESPAMVRPWNINSNMEAFISFKAGSYKWQVGPQVRYQPYSTFIPEYPIKEHLMDYGFKVGISRPLN